MEMDKFIAYLVVDDSRNVDGGVGSGLDLRADTGESDEISLVVSDSGGSGVRLRLEIGLSLVESHLVGDGSGVSLEPGLSLANVSIPT